MHNQQASSGYHSENYTYPQFIIDEKTGRVEVNFIDWASGRVVRYIPAAELNEIVRGQNVLPGMPLP